MPLAALTRGQFELVRDGSFRSAKLAWDEAWTMDDTVQPLFPVPSCALFGRKRGSSTPMPDRVRAYSGMLPMRDASEETADAVLDVSEDEAAPTAGVFEGGSAYRSAFRQGATLVPRVLCLVERRAMGRLGADPSAPLVASRRSTQEKRPWKELPGIENPVEAEFLRPVLVGESILSYRIFRSFEGIVPVTASGFVLNAEAAANRGLQGLHGWMRRAEAVWAANANSGPMTLVDRWNYHNELGAQFPIPGLRVLYAASGTLPAACLLRDERPVIEHQLYWTAAEGEAEGRYLAAILNSEAARERVAQYQARGQWGARHFDKVMFNLPIPRFDARERLHLALARAAERAEQVAAAVELPEGVRFQRARRLVRAALAEAGIAGKIDALVARLLDGG